ncbi:MULTISPECIES: DEAD/DEAH box helicase [unclassified Arcicella]|uniref:DEAD/DEAH box helicase n=1 Tax=unclassified Arcicella TaxID=2644986 RepID=UPI002854C4F5|nr:MULTISPECIES: DEAD/DEAH box helicase [unclassified Arcicella]MDR6560039.1 superfamily II DNA/RNA helicase [Arcicella sp. BE51]MDR6810354.1 superfamily II DNA/RNA helicase [Arcicella sp. BE140]MDR6821704.1 superfamily II DNA/RNA helicase [Arcicella sp. BE139]
METNQTTQQILQNLGIEALNPMQEAAQKAILEDNNVLLISPTGSGKTIGFLMPILQLLKPDVPSVQCLILTPSRELALQIEQVWKKMSTGYKVNVCYGGHDVGTEIKNLSNPPAVLIGTPGRIADHITRRSFNLDGIKTLVLDEFDKSLDLGFHEQMSFIIGGLRKLNKRVLVSATKGIKIPEFTGVSSPTLLNFIPEDKVAEGLVMKVVISEQKDKIDALFNLLCSINSESALIFLNHRDAAERTCELLQDMGIYAIFYHGGMDQDDRERALIQFRNGSVRYLVTTDLAARGLDIPEMKHVIHYHLPLQAHEFIHRNGRTARMNAEGTAYLIFSRNEHRPSYVDDSLEELEVPENNPLPQAPEFLTIYISGGKKNKLNKVDIVGFFSQKGKLEKGDLGLIEVKDFTSFAAVKKDKVKELLQTVRDEKMKGKKYKIEVAR